MDTTRTPAAPTTFPAARLDRPGRAVTFAVVVLLVVLVPGLLVPAAAEGTRALTAVVLGVGVAVLLVGAWGAGPVAFEVAGRCLRVRRRILPARTYRLTGAVRRAPATLGLGLRLGGSGGLFGWTGLFFKPGLGRYRAHLTDRSRIVACETDQGLVVVSPADPDALCAAAAEAGR